MSGNGARTDASAWAHDAAAAAARPATFALKCLLLAGMGLVFFSTYGFANWLAGRHAQVPSFAFGWEHAIPFWPWTIVPYWSIDLLYALSFFPWHWRDELLDHVKRLLTVQVISVVCFIAWPLRFSFERPAAGGMSGALFTLLAGFDKPFNQAPSLHIGLLVVLWAVYALYARGAWRWLLHGWFALIGISVLTTYQHHLIDVPTGAAVGCFALFLFPLRRGDGTSRSRAADEPIAPAVLAHARRIARRYAALAVVFLIAACVAIPHSPLAALLLGWIALAVLCVAIVYWRVDAALYQKNEAGGFAWATGALFLPTVIGMFVNSRAWTFRHAAFSPLGHSVLVGRTPTRREARLARATAIVDLTAEMPGWARRDPTIRYVCVPQLDLLPPTLAQLRQAVAAIERLREQGHTVLVCCALGYSRSALTVAAWLAVRLQLDDAQVALALLREARPQVVLREPGVALLQRYIDWRVQMRQEVASEAGHETPDEAPDDAPRDNPHGARGEAPHLEARHDETPRDPRPGPEVRP
ncbi:phosphatase PAP2/dual specificity phosphatase family protein [Paraburkholderia bryophila]|uniref:phosphatase PAP2/dual specificity phosphatase family protein n=1 Tax=Paraburkholderia bryophila TaxID=420952 RepID=UPI002349B306|nr:phosphatase PAP2/dual specificity phosphatase family protein [Paraburkholderia bryophila]WCM21678.1 phosphatase PAP2/dual specificity phosphatase family protein [Paraburkholderia bryophila]